MPKTLMPYPRLSYGFRLILQLKMHFLARYLILAFCVNSRWNRLFLGSFLSKEKKSRKLVRTSRRTNVATSQRRNVGSMIIGSQQVASVTTPQRCDVSAISASTSLKAKGPEIEGGIEKRTDEGTECRVAATQISGEDTCFCIFFLSERLLMVYRLIKCITKSSTF